MTHAQFCFRAIWLAPFVTLEVVSFGAALYCHYPGAIAFALALGIGIIASEIFVRFPAGRRAIAKSLHVHCSRRVEAAYRELLACCAASANPSGDARQFIERFNAIWAQTDVSWPFRTQAASKGMRWAFGSVYSVVLLACMVLPIISCILCWLPYSNSLQEPARLELGAMLGTFILAIIMQISLPEQRFPNMKVLAFVWLAMMLSICFTCYALHLPLRWHSLAVSWLDRDWVHIIGVLTVSALILVYDVIALYGINMKTSNSNHQQKEMFEMCVIVDVPMFLALLGAVSYWEWRREDLGKAAAGVLAGAVVMQFVISALLFVIIKRRINEIPEHQSGDHHERGAAAGM